jgi:hypothetical protein
MPVPKPDETREEFVKRCIPIVLEHGTAETQEQAVAVCNQMWEDGQKGTDPTGIKHGAGGGSAGFRGGRSGWRRAPGRVFARESKRSLYGLVRRCHMWAAQRNMSLPTKSITDGWEDTEDIKALPDSDWEDGKPSPMSDDDVREFFWMVIATLHVKFDVPRDELPGPIPDWALNVARSANSGKSIEYPIKLLHESPDEFVVGGYGHIWGGPGADSDLELNYFTPESDLMPALVPVKLATFEHSILDVTPDGDPFDGPIGKAYESETYVDRVGKWITARLDKRRAYIDAVMTLIDKRALNWSSGSIPHLTKIAQDGWIARWPVVEYAQTITPAEPRMTDVQRIRAVYKAAGLEVLWDLLKAQAEGPDGEGEGDEGRLALAQAKLNLLKLHTR